MTLSGQIPAVDRAILIDFFGERYGWTPDTVDSLPWPDAVLLMKSAEYKNKKIEADMKRR